MNQLSLQRTTISILAGASLVYCVAVLAYVSTTPDTGLRCLLSSSSSNADFSGLEIRSTELVGNCAGNTPADGDYLTEFAGHRIETFVEFAQASAELRTRPLEAGATLTAGSNPSNELPRESTLTLVNVEEQGLFAKIWFYRPETGDYLSGWVPLQRQALAGLMVSLVWFVFQLGITVLVGFAYWHRPYDRPLRLFLLTMVTAMPAYVGGNHWWVIAGSIWFLIPFAISAVLLPAVLLHFFLVYPFPKPVFTWHPRWALFAVYAIPLLAITGMGFLIVSGNVLSRDLGSGPLASLVELLGTEQIEQILPWLRWGISTYATVGAIYFVLSLAALVYSYLYSHRRYEHEQVRWILIAAFVATIPLSYALWTAYTDRVEFAFGSGRLPMFIASVLFMAAYAVGIIRYRMMLIDQILNRGILYYAVSLAVTLLFSMGIAFGTIAAVHRDMSVFGHPILVFTVLNLAVMMLLWLRDRLQRGIDREFFREKYQLDKALQRMNQAVSGLLDRGGLADRMLESCQEVLHAERGAIFMRDGQTRVFHQLASLKEGEFPERFEASREFVETLASGHSLQRVRSGSSPLQLSLRELGADLIHGLDVDGTLAGIIVLGAKPGSAGYTAEDVTYLSALGRVAGVTLHFGRIHEDLTRMNEELIRINEELTLKNHELERVQAELQEERLRTERQRKRIETLKRQLSLVHPAESDILEEAFSAGDILGRSPAMRSVLSMVHKVSPTDASVLVRGESGTGKELLARAIHENSPRRNGPLISVHCAALAPSVLESELFGHVKGAFTDARQDKPGRFQLADGGTLFLDEIGDVPLETQVKLLRALQERTIDPVGSSQSISVDVRLIAATHQNLEQLITEGKFREDLYYRLNVISIVLPPLRDRGEDIIELAMEFLRRVQQRTGKGVSHFDDEVLDKFLEYPWPGNVRELENVVERAVVLSEGSSVTLSDLPANVRHCELKAEHDLETSDERLGPAESADRKPEYRPSDSPRFQGTETQLQSEGLDTIVIGSEDERLLLQDALIRSGGNKAEAARLLGMPRSTYYSKLKKHGLG